MRPGQFNKNRNRNRNRGRHNNNNNSGGGGGNPANRVYDSNGPDVKVRGTAQTVAEKYMQLGRDAQSSGDIVMAESYYQHSEHYYRLWLANQPAGQPIQFARRGTEEEYEEDLAAEGVEGDDESPGGEMQPAAEGEAAPGGEEGGEGQGFNGEQGQPPQRNFRQREYRDNREPREFRDNREPRGEGQNQGQGQDGQSPREGGRDRFRSRWGRRDRNNEPYRNREQGNGDYAERPAERVPEEAAAPAEGGNWEAPSFLTRPVPPVAAIVDEAPEAPAPVERKPRGRRPKVEVEAAPSEDAAE